MPRALCIFVLGSLSVHIFIMGTIIKEMMQIQFLALNLWVCIMLDLNGFSSASYQGILVKYLFFFQRKKKKKPLREENEYFSSFSFLEEVLWGQNKYESRSWGRDVCPCVGKTLFLSSSTRPRQWERQDTGSERRFSPSVSQCFCRRQRGPTRRGSALGTAVTSAGKLSLFKPESRAECGLPGRDLLRVDS